MADPYIPQATPAGPSPQAVAGLGGALENLGLMIAGKLDQAEMASQYNNGQEILRRNLNQFELNLQSDPNWQEYPAKLAAAESQWWTQIDGVVKHQGAKNALQQWWMTARDSAEARVGQAQLNVRGNAILGTYQQNIDGLAKDPTIDPAAKKARWEELTRPLVQSLLIDPATAETRRKDFYHAADLLGAENGAMAIVRQAGSDGLPNYDGARVFVNDPSNPLMQNLTESERQSLDSHITQLETVQDKQDTRANDKTEEALAKEYSNVIENDLPPLKLKQLIDDAKDKWQGKEIAARDEKWATKYRTIIDNAHQQAVWQRSLQGGFDSTVAYTTLYPQMLNPYATTESKLDILTKAMAPGKDANGKATAPQIGIPDAKKLAASIKDSSTVIHDSAMRLQGLAAKDSVTGAAGPLTADDVKVGQAMLQEMVDKTPNLTPAQISDETDRIAAYLQQRAVRKAIATAFSGDTKSLVAAEQDVAGFGAIAKTAEGQKVITAIRTEQTAELKARSIDATPFGVDQMNRTIFKASNGDLYYQDSSSGAPVWKVKKTWNQAWVTLK